MSGSKDAQKALQADLQSMLADRFPGIEVEVGHSKRWNRPCITARWKGFSDLLPEERFQRLAAAIPDTFRESRLDGFVWLELAPGETVEAFLKLPRSEDIADREADIYGNLRNIGFFDALADAMKPSPKKKCDGGFTQARAVLAARKQSESSIYDAQLLFIRHGAYCDCQALLSVRSELARQFAHVA